MSKKRGSRAARGPSRTRGAGSKSSRRRRSARGPDPLLWAGVAVGVIAALLVLNAWRSGAFARWPEPSRDEDAVVLLPLAGPQHPLQGGHDMALIPQRTPTSQSAPSDVPLPHLEVPSATHDFGRVYGRWDVTHTFAVQNVGTADLVLHNLVTSCGCTTAELSSSVIPPGQRADLTVAFDADFHETDGQVTRLVWFATNDTTQPWVEVRITADVR